MIRLCAFADEASASLEGQIAALKRNNISLIELRNVDGKSVKDLTLDEGAAYAKTLHEAGIRVWSIGSPLGKADIGVELDAYLEEVRHICRLANLFGAEHIRIFSFYGAYEKRETVMQYLSSMVEVAREFGVMLCHENEKEIYGDTVARVCEIMQAVKGLKFIYDPANYIQCGENILQAMELLHGSTEYFHIKDVISETEELVPAGCGDGQIAELVARITDDKVLTVEPHLALFSGYGNIDNTEMKHKFHFESNDESFDAAVAAMKTILVSCGYQEREGGFEK